MPHRSASRNVHTLRPARHEDVDVMSPPTSGSSLRRASPPAQWHPERARETLAWLVDADGATVLARKARACCLVDALTVGEIS